MSELSISTPHHQLRGYMATPQGTRAASGSDWARSPNRAIHSCGSSGVRRQPMPSDGIRTCSASIDERWRRRDSRRPTSRRRGSWGFVSGSRGLPHAYGHVTEDRDDGRTRSYTSGSVR
jgi:hypothetical protein